MILALLPVIVFLLLTLYLADCDGFQGDRRSAFLAALVILGVLIMVSTKHSACLTRSGGQGSSSCGGPPRGPRRGLSPGGGILFGTERSR